MKITIIGTGTFSVAIALQLAKNKDNKIMFWTENKNFVQEFKTCFR